MADFTPLKLYVISHDEARQI